MATLTNTKIKDTYDGLLKTTDNEALDVSGVTLIEDGLGNASALSVGRSGNGVAITGALSAGAATLSSASVSGNLAVDTNTLYVDAASNEVGIGTSSPAGKLSVLLGETNLSSASAAATTGYPLSIRFTGTASDNNLIRHEASANPTGYYTLMGTRYDNNKSFVINNKGSEIITYSDITSNGLGLSGGAGNLIRFDTNGSEAMRIDSSGNVGIGTSSPKTGSKLTIQHDTTGGSLPTYNLPVIVDGQDMALGNGGGIKFGGVFTTGGTPNGDMAFIKSYKENATSGNYSYALTFGTRVNGGNPTERMRIDSSGNVGIGVTPSSWSLGGLSALQIRNAGLYGFDLNEVGVTANAYYNGGYKYISSDSASMYLQDTNSNHIFRHAASGTAGAAITWSESMRITSGGFLKASNNGTYIGSTGAYHEFNSNTANQFAHFIQNTDASGFGTQIICNSDTTTKYYLEGYSTSAGTARVRIYTNGNIVNTNNSYGAISDAKLKENVVDATPKLDDLLQVKIRNFNYIGSEEKQLGVVAQELEEVFPSMIDESPDFEEQEVIDEEGNVTKERVDLGTTTKSVKYSVFVPMLIKAMQEQQEIINDLKARIETLEAK